MADTTDLTTAAGEALATLALHGNTCAAALVAEIERLRAIEAALDADAGPTAPCLLCGSHGPVSLVASRRGSFWLCDDAAECRARKGGAK